MEVKEKLPKNSDITNVLVNDLIKLETHTDFLPGLWVIKSPLSGISGVGVGGVPATGQRSLKNSQMQPYEKSKDKI